MPLAALKVAKPLEDDGNNLSPSAAAYLRQQAAKPLEQRVSEIELWQLGANDYLATLNDLHEFTTWFRHRAKRWVPILLGAAATTGVFGPQLGGFITEVLQRAAH